MWYNTSIPNIIYWKAPKIDNFSRWISSSTPITDGTGFIHENIWAVRSPIGIWDSLLFKLHNTLHWLNTLSNTNEVLASLIFNASIKCLVLIKSSKLLSLYCVNAYNKYLEILFLESNAIVKRVIALNKLDFLKFANKESVHLWGLLGNAFDNTL